MLNPQSRLRVGGQLIRLLAIATNSFWKSNWPVIPDITTTWEELTHFRISCWEFQAGRSFRILYIFESFGIGPKFFHIRKFVCFTSDVLPGLWKYWGLHLNIRDVVVKGIQKVPEGRAFIDFAWWKVEASHKRVGRVTRFYGLYVFRDQVWGETERERKHSVIRGWQGIVCVCNENSMTYLKLCSGPAMSVSTRLESSRRLMRPNMEGVESCAWEMASCISLEVIFKL